MSTIISNITTLVSFVPDWVNDFIRLMFTYESNGPGVSKTGVLDGINGITFVGFVCLVLPLVGLGIGIIRRLVSIRA